MRTPAEIRKDVDRGAEIVAEMAALKREKESIEARLKQDALDRPDEHEPLADAEREGRQFLARGSKSVVPIVFTADLLVKSFATGSKLHSRIYTAAGRDDIRLHSFYAPANKFEAVIKDGLAFRRKAPEIFGELAPGFIAACRALDKHGVPKSAIKVEWNGFADDSESEGEP